MIMLKNGIFFYFFYFFSPKILSFCPVISRFLAFFLFNWFAFRFFQFFFHNFSHTTSYHKLNSALKSWGYGLFNGVIFRSSRLKTKKLQRLLKRSGKKQKWTKKLKHHYNSPLFLDVLSLCVRYKKKINT